MKSNIRIAKQLVRIARILVAFNRNELEKQLKKKRSDLNEESLKEHLDCLEKMDAKEQKVALYWINKKSLILPDDLSTFNNAMNLINKQHLDFQKFDNPMEVLNRDDKSTLRIRSQDERFNPATEKTFSHPYNAGDGVVIYNVEDSKEGQKAVRRAMDFYFGYDKNFWCLASRKEGFNRNEINRLTREQAEKLGLYSDDALAVAWNYWNGLYKAYPKRIAFKNGKLFAFSAGKHKQHVEWWDRNNDSHYDIPESNAVDDVEFLKKYGKINLLENNNASPEMIEELAEDEDANVRYEVAKHPNTPADILTKLADDKDVYVRRAVAENPKAPVEALKKLAEDKNDDVRWKVSENPNTPVEALRKLAEDEDAGVREEVARDSRTPIEILRKLAGDKNYTVRYRVADNPNIPVDILRKLAEDEYADVRSAVVNNPKTPIEVLKKLAEDEDWRVRRAVTYNPNTPVDILTKLAEDEVRDVRRAVAENSRTPVGVLTKLAEDKIDGVRRAVTYNPNTPVDILTKLVEDEDAGVREGVAKNPNTPYEILRKLAEDKNDGVRRATKSQLRHRRQ